LQSAGLRVSEVGRAASASSGRVQGSSSQVAASQATASQATRGRVAPATSVATPLIETSPPH
jgi:hypothetical protein